MFLFNRNGPDFCFTKSPSCSIKVNRIGSTCQTCIKHEVESVLCQEATLSCCSCLCTDFDVLFIFLVGCKVPHEVYERKRARHVQGRFYTTHLFCFHSSKAILLKRWRDITFWERISNQLCGCFAITWKPLNALKNLGFETVVWFPASQSIFQCFVEDTEVHFSTNAFMDVWLCLWQCIS